MENGPVEDVFPIENGDFPLLYWFTRGYKRIIRGHFFGGTPFGHQPGRKTVDSL